MKKPLHIDQQTWEAMESCRPGVDDLNDPAMQQLAAEMAAKPDLEKAFDRLQLLDSKIGSAFQDVDVPQGIVKRISDRLAAECANKVITAALHEQSGPVLVDNQSVSAPLMALRRKISRRWLIAAGGILCTSLIAMIALWLGLNNAQNFSEQIVLDEAIRLIDAGESNPGFLLAERAPPRGYPFSRAVLYSKGIRGREVPDFLGKTAFAYDLPIRDGSRATLYVINQRVAGIGNRPRLQPFTTGGRSASAWQEGGLLYVLVVQGEPKAYQNYLDIPRGPTA